MRQESRALENYGRYQVVKTYQLPLRIRNGTISSFDITYFEFPQGRYHAISKGVLRGGENVPVRINSECMWGRFGSVQCDCHEQYEESKKIIDDENLGMVVFAHDQIGKSVGLREHAIINSEANLSRGERQLYQMDIWAEPFIQHGGRLDYRDFTDVSEIIRYFRIISIELLTNNPNKIEAMEQNGILVVARRPLVAPRTEFNDLELRLKK